MAKCDHPYEDCWEDDCYCGCPWCSPSGTAQIEEDE